MKDTIDAIGAALAKAQAAPKSREASLAITRLEEALFWALRAESLSQGTIK